MDSKAKYKAKENSKNPKHKIGYLYTKHTKTTICLHLFQHLVIC